jgi:hypothetical protein
MARAPTPSFRNWAEVVPTFVIFLSGESELLCATAGKLTLANSTALARIREL